MIWFIPYAWCFRPCVTFSNHYSSIFCLVCPILLALSLVIFLYEIHWWFCCCLWCNAYSFLIWVDVNGHCLAALDMMNQTVSVKTKIYYQHRSRVGVSEDLIWNWIPAVVGYTWYWWDDAVDRDWSKCFYVCLCALAVAELFHVAHKLVDLYATSAVRTLRLLRLLPSWMFCIGLVCFYIVYRYLYIDFFCVLLLIAISYNWRCMYDWYV